MVVLFYLWFVVTFITNFFQELNSLHFQNTNTISCCRVSSIEVDKLTVHRYIALSYSKEVHPGPTSFSRMKGCRAIPAKHRCLCSFPPRKCFSLAFLLRSASSSFPPKKCFYLAFLLRSASSSFPPKKCFYLAFLLRSASSSFPPKKCFYLAFLLRSASSSFPPKKCFI